MEQGPKLLPLAMLTEHYEKLRASVLAQDGCSALRLGQGAVMSPGVISSFAYMQGVVAGMGYA